MDFRAMQHCINIPTCINTSVAVQFCTRQCRDAIDYCACNHHIHFAMFSNFRRLNWVIKLQVNNRYVTCFHMFRPEMPQWNQFLLSCKVWSEIAVGPRELISCWQKIKFRALFAIMKEKVLASTSFSEATGKLWRTCSPHQRKKKPNNYFSFLAVAEIIFLLLHFYFTISGFFFWTLGETSTLKAFAKWFVLLSYMAIRVDTKSNSVSGFVNFPFIVNLFDQLEWIKW